METFRPRSATWQRVEVDDGSVLGVPARRTHQFELQSVRRNTFPYRCKCQEHQLTVRRHNRVVRGEAVYRCVHCGEQLVAK